MRSYYVRTMPPLGEGLPQPIGMIDADTTEQALEKAAQKWGSASFEVVMFDNVAGLSGMVTIPPETDPTEATAEVVPISFDSSKEAHKELAGRWLKAA